MSLETRKNSTRKIRNDLGSWTGLNYLWSSKGLRNDVKQFTRRRRNNRYKNKLMNIKKKILKQQYLLDELGRKEKHIYDKFKHEEEIYDYNNRYNEKFKNIGRE